MNTVLDESMALLQLREKLVRFRDRNEPRDLIEIIESQIIAQVKLDAERANKVQVEKDKRLKPFDGNTDMNIENDLKTLIKLNTHALKMIQDFGRLDKNELKAILTQVGRCYQAMLPYF